MSALTTPKLAVLAEALRERAAALREHADEASEVYLTTATSATKALNDGEQGTARWLAAAANDLTSIINAERALADQYERFAAAYGVDGERTT